MSFHSCSHGTVYVRTALGQMDERRLGCYFLWLSFQELKWMFFISLPSWYGARQLSLNWLAKPTNCMNRGFMSVAERIPVGQTDECSWPSYMDFYEDISLGHFYQKSFFQSQNKCNISLESCRNESCYFCCTHLLKPNSQWRQLQQVDHPTTIFVRYAKNDVYAELW